MIYVCLLYDGSTRRLTESGFMEKPGIEPATSGLRGIALIHYTTGASQKNEAFCGFSMGRNQYWAGRVYDLCVYYMTGTPEGSTESGFMEKPGIEPQKKWCSTKSNYVFVTVFLGCTSTGRVGLCFLWFYVQELPKAQPAVVLVLKSLRRRGNGLKSHPTDWI